MAKVNFLPLLVEVTLINGGKFIAFVNKGKPLLAEVNLPPSSVEVIRRRRKWTFHPRLYLLYVSRVNFL